MSIKEITQDEFEEICDTWESVTDSKVYDTSRWHTHYEQVFKDPETGKFYNFNWAQGSTEYQEGLDEVYMIEVEPYEVTVTKYRVVKD